MTRASVVAYREAMAGFAQMGRLEVWYAHLTEEELLQAMRRAAKAAKTKKQAKAARRAEQTAEKVAAKARTRDSLQALSKLAERVDGRYRIVSQPRSWSRCGSWRPPLASLPRRWSGCSTNSSAYRATLQDDRRRLLEQFEVVDVARKVVGVGSVGTRAFIALLQGRDQHDPLFLQVKEATRSVLEARCPRAATSTRASGWSTASGCCRRPATSSWAGQAKLPATHHLYWRQLRDMKGSAEVEAMAPVGLRFYAGICGWTLARPRPLRRPHRHRRLPR